MPSDVEVFLGHVEHVFGTPASRFRQLPATRPGLKPITAVFFENYPQPGNSSAVTYGLSLSDHPAWKHGRPELMISVEDDDPAWGMAIGDIAEQHRGESTFSYGQTVDFGGRISDRSEMSGFFLFAPTLVERTLVRQEYAIPLSRYTVFLTGLYPMYAEEITVYRRIGLEQFWKHPDFDRWNIRRPRLT